MSKPSRFSWAALAASALVLALGGRASAAGAHPDFSGMWQYDYSPAGTRGQPAPPLNPQTADLVARRHAAMMKGYVRDIANMKCLPTGMPLLMQWRSPIEILQDLNRVTIVTEHDPGNDEPRTVYLNEKTHPADAYPTWNGHSIGHWEGDVLVVDTVNFNERANLLKGAPRTSDTHIVERFSLSPDGRTLTDEMTFTDPHVLTKPWTAPLIFHRLPDDTERLEAVCEVDLDALQKVDVDALKAVDVEAQRMTDPSLRYNPGGK